MSLKAMQWVWDHSKTRNGARLLMLAIADNAGEDGGHAWPSNAELQRKTALKERGVRMAIAECVKLGELEVTYNTGNGGTNNYRIIMGGGAESTGLSTPPPADNAPRQILPGGADNAGGQILPPPGPGKASSQVKKGKGGRGANIAPRQNVPGRGAESAPGIVNEPDDDHPREAGLVVAAVAAGLALDDDDDQAGGDPDRIPRLVAEVLTERTGRRVDLAAARRIAAGILDGHRVANPVAYVRRALEQERDPVGRFALDRPTTGTLPAAAGDSACDCLGSGWVDNPDGSGVHRCPNSCSPSTVRRTA